MPKYCTVGTPDKGQLIFWENGPNKGNLEIPLFAFFTKSQIRKSSNKGLFQIQSGRNGIDYESPY